MYNGLKIKFRKQVKVFVASSATQLLSGQVCLSLPLYAPFCEPHAFAFVSECIDALDRTGHVLVCVCPCVRVFVRRSMR